LDHACLQPNINCIIKDNTGKIQTLDRISELNFENGNIQSAKEIACTFNKFFLSTAENLNTDHQNIGEAIKLLNETYICNITEIKITPVTQPEIISIIRSN
jgi:hypothetical protein